MKIFYYVMFVITAVISVAGIPLVKQGMEFINSHDAPLSYVEFSGIILILYLFIIASMAHFITLFVNYDNVNNVE